MIPQKHVQKEPVVLGLEKKKKKLKILCRVLKCLLSF